MRLASASVGRFILNLNRSPGENERVPFTVLLIATLVEAVLAC